MTAALAEPALDDEPFSDEELTELALAADPDAALADDAVPISEVLGGAEQTLLPTWYLPGAVAGPRQARGWKRRVTWLIVCTFLGIDAFGLCSTYGQVVLAGVPAISKHAIP